MPLMTIQDGTRFEVRDADLPDRPPLAKADDYTVALDEVARLESEFFDQLDANGEGAAGISLHLRVDELTPDAPPLLRFMYSVGGHR